MFKLKGFLFIFLFLIIMAAPVFASNSGSATSEFIVQVPEYTNIKSVKSPVLVANITNKSGNLDMPLSTQFNVATNVPNKTLYLQSHVVTAEGYESSMFEYGGHVYIAFANLSEVPKSKSLDNCKRGGMQKDSPGVVAYPVSRVSGAEHKYIPEKGKYEVYVNNGETDVVVNVGANVLINSFGANDPQGLYQATLSLTEVDI